MPAKVVDASALAALLFGEPEAQVVAEVLLLADSENLTVYDTSYLWLAEKSGLDLVFLDGDLMAAFTKRSKGDKLEKS